MNLNPADLLLTSYPGCGPGAMIAGIPQGVRVQHLPTGMVTTATHHRHQHANRADALVLMAALLPHHAAQVAEAKVSAPKRDPNECDPLLRWLNERWLAEKTAQLAINLDHPQPDQAAWERHQTNLTCYAILFELATREITMDRLAARLSVFSMPPVRIMQEQR